MGTFAIGMAAAIAIAVVSAFGLNALSQSTPDAFYTRYTVPLGNEPPTDGSLAHHHPDTKQQKQKDQPR